MRDRVPADWKVDLRERHALEADVRNELAAHPELAMLQCSTASTERLDYQLVGPGARLLEVELKTKRQVYRGWSRYRPEVAEKDLLILDELALRKLVDAGRYAFLLVRDIPADRWAVWSTHDLVMTPKARVTRQLAVGTGAVKGKVLISFAEDASLFPDAGSAVDFIVETLRSVDQRWQDIAPWPSPHRAS
ncbi:MAG TPA: hypothetical protein VM754_04565 [Actinomycetota bacterium]|nr:hypothetical protein [Actinomycetota bacterium]